MVYCCQNHSGSPALTAPVPKKALTPCATVYGFDAPFQAVLQAPPAASLDTASVNASLYALKQAELVQGEAAGMAICKANDNIVQLLGHQARSRYAPQLHLYDTASNINRQHLPMPCRLTVAVSDPGAVHVFSRSALIQFLESKYRMHCRY